MATTEARRSSTRAGDYETSVEAAESAAHGAATIRALVVLVLQAHPAGLTDDELRPLVVAQLAALGKRAPAESSIRKRRGELVDDGEVEQVTDATGAPVTRPNVNGNRMNAWRLVQPPRPEGALW
jgi:hypothetical protein